MIKPRHTPLDNVKHEQFVRNLVVEPTHKDAFLKTYNNVSEGTARTSSSRLLANENIRSRFLGLLEQAGSGLPVVASRLHHWINQTEHPSTSMDGIKTALKISGALDPEDQSKNMTNVQIAIGIMTLDGTVNNVTIEG